MQAAATKMLQSGGLTQGADGSYTYCTGLYRREGH